MKLLVLTIGLIFTLALDAQASKIDSLKSVLQKPIDDTVRFVIYNQLANAYMLKNPDSAIHYANNTLDYFKNKKHYKGLGDTYRVIAIANTIKFKYNDAEQYFQKSYNYFKLLNEDHDKYASMHFTNMNILYSMQAKYSEAMLYIDSAMMILVNKHDTNSIKTLSKLYSNKANMLNSQGLYSDAISSSLKAIELANSVGENKGNGVHFINIGNSFGYLEEYNKAIKYFIKAKEHAKRFNNNYILTKALNNLAVMYQNIEKYDEAIQIDIKLIKMLDSLGMERNKLPAIITLAKSYNLIGKNKKAEKYFRTSLSISKKYDDDLMKLSSYTNYAAFLINSGEIKKGIKYNNQALKIATAHNDHNKLVDIYNNAYDAYEQEGQLDSALFFIKKYIIIKDSLENANVKNEINNLEIKYQSVEKEKENQKLQFENRLQKEANSKEKAIYLYIISSSGLIILLLIITFFMFRNRQKHIFNKQMLDEIDEQNDIISKNLHDGLSGYLHAIKNSLVYKNKDLKSLENEIKIIDRSQKELRFLMRQLSSPYYKNKNFDLSKELNELNYFYENTSSFKIDSYFDSSIIWDNISYENKLHIYKLAQELLANIKKHSGATDINLQIIKDKNDLIMSFEDNGKGFNIEESSQGYGLKNIYKRIKELNGELNIDSVINKGTFITLKLPVLS